MMPSPGALLHQINHHWCRKHNPSTVFFEDGFEDCAFGAWSGTSGDPSCSSDYAHHGSYSMKIIDDWRYAYVNFAEQSTIYARFYVRWTTNPAADEQWFMFYLRNQVYGTVFTLRLRATAIGDILLQATSEAPYSEANYFWTPSVDTWYCFEFEGVVADLGEYRVWIDGVERITKTNQDTNDRGNVDQMRLGAGGMYVNTGYFDCVVIADTYIGPEVPPPVAGAKALIGGLYLVFPD